MKQTIEKMSLVLEYVETEINRGRTREAKTLMNTYRNLYGELLTISINDYKTIEEIDSNSEVLNININLLKALEEKSGKTWVEMLKNSNYKDADNMVEVKKRIHIATHELSGLISESTNQKLDKQSKGTDIALIDGGANGTTIYIFNIDSGKVKFNSAYSGKVRDQVLRLIRIIDKYKPNQVIFDKRGIGEVMYERFIEDATLTGITVKENGLVIYN